MNNTIVKWATLETATVITSSFYIDQFLSLTLHCKKEAEKNKWHCTVHGYWLALRSWQFPKWAHLSCLLIKHLAYSLFRGLFQLLGHVLSTGLVILLDPGCVWGVVSGIQHWTTWSNGHRHTFKPTKPLKPKSNNHDNGWKNMLCV